MEGTLVNLTCHVSYAGEMHPQMKWTKAENDNGNITDESDHSDAKNGFTRQTVVLKATRLEHEKKFECLTYFDEVESDDDNAAKNKPAYKHTCEPETTIAVHCKYRKLFFAEQILSEKE